MRVRNYRLPPPSGHKTASRAAYRLDYAHDSVGHDSVRNCSGRPDLRPELLNQSGIAAVTSLAARGLTDTRTRAAASLAGWPLPVISAASDNRLSGIPTRRAPLVIGASTYGAT